MWSVRQGAAAATVAAGGPAIQPRGRAVAAAWGRRRPSSAISGAGGGLCLPGCPQCRSLQCSAALCGSTNLLKKFLSKHKKKFWYESPTLGPHLVNKPSNLAKVLNLTPPKARKEDGIRKKALNVLLLKAVRDVLSTCDAGQEAYDLNVELSKATIQASLTSDFSTCRIFWMTSGNTEQDGYIDKVLQKSAPRIRHLLISQQVLGTVPTIVFLRDKEAAAVRETERLLATIDLGPLDEENELVQNDFSESSSTMAGTFLDTSHSPIPSNLFGIDHEALNKQIMEYKRMKKDKEIEGIGLSEQQQEQLAEIRKQKKMRRKIKKPFDDDVTPQKYLMDKHWDDYRETESLQENESEYELQEIENEIEVDNRKH
ncbi:hypothetical protein lerEdw1_007078 [Lerista edwardsae]|nr:hypothetical protein lerEdw1_007078 [Lerista edwardsae]